MNGLIITRQDGWTELALNRPEQRNALNTALLAAIAGALAQAAKDPDCRAVLITGADGTFAAGADLSEIEGATSATAAADPRKAHWEAIRSFPKPMVAAIDGHALGGGFELALMADLIVLGDSARVGLPETTLGLMPGAGGGQRLLGLVGRLRASRMVLMGEVIDAATAADWGLCSHRAPEALAEGRALCARIAQRAPMALAAAKAALWAGAEAGLAFQTERAGFEALLDSEDKTLGIRAFREKRRPDFRGA